MGVIGTVEMETVAASLSLSMGVIGTVEMETVAASLSLSMGVRETAGDRCRL